MPPPDTAAAPALTDRRACFRGLRHNVAADAAAPTWCRLHLHGRYHRVEVLGALASILTVWLVTGILLVEAIQRIITPEAVNGKSECGGVP